MVELLAVVATTGLLAVLAVGATRKVLHSGDQVREIQAARRLVGALMASAQDNDGVYLPGMDYRMGKPETPVCTPDGERVTGHAAQRYPFRLAPYLDATFEETIFVNRNKKEIIKRTGGKGPMYDYHVSTFPVLGMNIFGVGGVVRADGTVFSAGNCITRSAAMRGSVLAFVSGGSGSGKAKIHGFNYVSPPTLQQDSPIALRWQGAASWTADQDPMAYGWVDFRYEGKAVSAFLDGSVRMCSVQELSDMRVWTPSAQDLDDPSFLMNP